MRPNTFGRCTALTLATAVAACSDHGAPTQLHPGLAAASFQQAQNQVDGADFGFTAGWLQARPSSSSITSLSSAARRSRTGIPLARAPTANSAPTAPPIRGPGTFRRSS